MRLHIIYVQGHGWLLNEPVDIVGFELKASTIAFSVIKRINYRRKCLYVITYLRVQYEANDCVLYVGILVEPSTQILL